MSKIYEYKQQHPEYRNIPDLELAEKLYETYYKGKMSETEFYELSFPNIAAERFEEDIADTSLESIDIAPAVFKPTVSNIAEQAGVSINDPANFKARFGGSLGYNQEQKIAFLLKLTSILIKPKLKFSNLAIVIVLLLF